MINFFDAQPQTSQAEKELRPLIFDEGCQVLSTFELNKIASLTFGDLVCDEIFEMVEKIVTRPLDHTPLTMQKTLVMVKHVLIYGSEKCVNSAYGLGGPIAQLQTFNTIIMAQQQQGARAMWQRLQGGGVDRGGPVREAAAEVHKLLSNIHELQRIRLTSASKDSLVPIGDDKVAFISDEVRHYLLKKRIEQQHQIQIKSNLAKSEGGFGGGYNATDGKSVVGAAHGIDEMIKMAKLEKKKWSDDGGADSKKKSEEMKILEELKAQADAEKAEQRRRADEAAAERNAALLAYQKEQAAKAAEVDLLDFGGGGGVAQPAPASNLMGSHDFFGATPAPAASGDLLGLGLGGMPPQPTASSTVTDIFSLATTPAPGAATSLVGNSSTTIPVDPFAPIASATPSQPEPPTTDSLLSVVPPTTTTTTQQPPHDPSGLLSLGGGAGGVTSQMSAMSLTAPAEPAKKSIMGSNQDRFAALDDLASTSTTTTSTVTELDRKNAENRILGFTSGSSSSSSAGLGVTPNLSLGGAGAGAPPMGMPPPPPPGDSPAAMGGAGLMTMSMGAMPPAPPIDNGLMTMSMGAMPPPSGDDGLLSMPMGMPPPPPEPVVVNPGSVRVGQTYGDAPANGDDDDDNPWVMGGVTGSGLDPLAPAPGAPPPPPP